MFTTLRPCSAVHAMLLPSAVHDTDVVQDGWPGQCTATCFTSALCCMHGPQDNAQRLAQVVIRTGVHAVIEACSHMHTRGKSSISTASSQTLLVARW